MYQISRFVGNEQVQALIGNLNVPPLCSQIDSMPTIEIVIHGYKFVLYPRDYMVFVGRSCSLGMAAYKPRLAQIWQTMI
jgi:hypothetical protein